MWTKAINFLLDAENQRFLLLVALVGALVFGFSQCEKKKAYRLEVDKQKNNIEALQDSVGFYENKAGELTAEKLALQTDKQQLKTLNSDLHNELKKEQEKVEQLTQINTRLVADSSDVDSTNTDRIDVNHWRFNWSLERGGAEWRRVLKGYTEFFIKPTGIPYNPNTQITKDLVELKFITGITEKDGKRRIFVRSTYPNLQVTDIQGAVLQESAPVSTPSRFGVGLSLGAGYTPQGFNPYIGVGINYNIIRF